ncbi:hypothetical protein LEP1GSC137_4204 [Leptospira borgpetersenii str. Noumea 25]|nr:hypothetical protein LEP1GSC137_4204 [Leptospira borgpetersenii str. Noumea 25]
MYTSGTKVFSINNHNLLRLKNKNILQKLTGHQGTQSIETSRLLL